MPINHVQTESSQLMSMEPICRVDEQPHTQEKTVNNTDQLLAIAREKLCREDSNSPAISKCSDIIKETLATESARIPTHYWKVWSRRFVEHVEKMYCGPAIHPQIPKTFECQLNPLVRTAEQNTTCEAQTRQLEESELLTCIQRRWNRLESVDDFSDALMPHFDLVFKQAIEGIMPTTCTATCVVKPKVPFVDDGYRRTEHFIVSTDETINDAKADLEYQCSKHRALADKENYHISYKESISNISCAEENEELFAGDWECSARCIIDVYPEPKQTSTKWVEATESSPEDAQFRLWEKCITFERSFYQKYGIWRVRDRLSDITCSKIDKK